MAETASQLAEDSTGSGPVLVTGGAGFIGSHVANALLARGDQVVVVDEVNDYYDVRVKRSNLELLTSTYPKRVSVYEGDICDASFINKVFAAHPDMKRVIHLAARAGVRPSIQDPFVYIHSNLEATTRLLELARLHGCDHFVYASSSSVYGESYRDTFSEDDIVETPVSPYAATKKMCELVAHTYHHLYAIPVAGLRFFTVYGPRGRPDMAPFKFVDRVMRGIEIHQYGDGTSSRDYTYIDDITDGVIRTLDRPNGYQVYNLGNGNPIALKEFISIVEKCCNKDAVIVELPPQPGDVPRTCADITKARTMLGYSPKTSFQDGIQKTVDWYREHYAKVLESDGNDVAPEDEIPIPRSETGSINELPTEEFIRSLPSLPPSLPSEVSQLIARLHLEASQNSLSSSSANSDAQASPNAESNRTWSPATSQSNHSTFVRLNQAMFSE